MRLFVSFTLSITALFTAQIAVWAAPAKGPLRASEVNPRYFTDGSGKAIYLTGSHVWNNLIDMGLTDPPPKFDFDAYLDWMTERNHNFMRMWAWELLSWDTAGNHVSKKPGRHFVAPHPWRRTGPGPALDGKPKFNLEDFDPDYFKRLYHRVAEAGRRGIYVSVMLFEGWGLQFAPGAWESHPFNPDNNINGIDGDLNGDGSGVEIHELVNPDILAIQQAYVRKVIGTLNGLDNLLYEISNENHPESTEWQYAMIRYIKECEAGMPKQHPVGMTFQYKGGSNQTLFDSPADWISPNNDGNYRDNPPADDGKKVILTDTDHLWGIGGDQTWVWKSFLRGLNPLFMDPYDGAVLGDETDPRWPPLRKSLGYARRYAQRMDLVNMSPQNDLASTSYCLANPGNEYLVYLPKGGNVTLDLSKAKGRFAVEWFNPNTDSTKEAKKIHAGKKLNLSSPFGEKDAVLYLKK